MSETPQLSIVILTSHASRTHVDACLASLGRQTRQDFEIIVVDNASTDDTCDMVRHRYPSVVIVENRANLGYSGGMNAGVKRARGVYVWALNNDTTVEPTAVEVLLAQWSEMTAHAVGLLPKIVYESEPDVIQTLGTRFTPDCRVLPLNSGRKAVDVAESRRVFGDLFVAPCFRREQFQLIGGFEDSFTNGGEDWEISYRINFAGFEMWTCPGCVVRHKVSATQKFVRLADRHRTALPVFLEIPLVYYTVPNLVLWFPVAFARLWLYHGVIRSIAAGQPPLEVLRAQFGVIMQMIRGRGQTLAKRRRWQAERTVPDRQIWSISTPTGFTGHTALTGAPPAGRVD